MQNSYKLARTRRHVVGMSCGFVHISQNPYKYRINSYRIARVYLYFVMNIVDMSYGTRRALLTKTLVTQLVDICGDMWRVITRANSSHIVGKLVTVGQGLKHWHLIHYVIVRRTDRQDVRVTKTMCGADCWTDHRLVVSKLNLRIQPARRPQGKKAPKRLDVSKLNHDNMRQAFINDISNQLGAMNLSSEDPEENWTVFQKNVHSSAATTIGHPSRKHQDWFDENDEEITLLLEEKHCLHKAHQDDTSSVSKKAAYNNICKTVQNRLRDMQDSWLSKKAEEIQSFADRKDMKKFHDALKSIYGPKSSGATPLLSADESTLLTDKDAILKRWAEHFNSVLNRPSSVNDNAINRLPQIHVECNFLLDEFPTVTETRKAIQHLSSGKAPGTDAIPAEVYKASGLLMAEKTDGVVSMHVEKGGYPTRLQGCFLNPPIQTERKSSSL